MYKKTGKRTIIWKMPIAAVCCLAFLLAGCKNQAGFYVTQEEGQEADSMLPPKEARTPDTGQSEDGAEGKSDEPEKVSNPEIYVQISGAVETPGVYKLPEGSRIFEAVELAGGTTEEADLASVNQAEVLNDGQMVYIYAIGEEPVSREGTPGSAKEDNDGRVNLNTASAEELMTLPGIGQSKAEDIISWRENNGGFQRAEDIMNIQGIKEGVFSKLRDRIKVN